MDNIFSLPVIAIGFFMCNISTIMCTNNEKKRSILPESSISYVFGKGQF